MKQKKCKVGYIYNNKWQLELYNNLIYTSNEEVEVFPLELVGYYSKKALINPNAFSLERKFKFFREFSILDGLLNQLQIKYQVNKWLNYSKIDFLLIDNPDRYLERILLRRTEKHVKVIFMQHGFDPMMRLFTVQNSIKSLTGVLFRNLIFSKRLSANPFNSINSVNRARTVVYSEYIKRKLGKYMDHEKIFISRDPKLRRVKTEINLQPKTAKNSELLVFTGLFRYKNFEKYLPSFLANLEKLEFNNIYLKTKIGESEILKKHITDSKYLLKNYTILDHKINWINELNNYSRIMCSIESTVCLELISNGINRFFVYDLNFYSESLIRKSIIGDCEKVCEGLYEYDISQKVNMDVINYYLGLDLPLLKFDNVRF